MTQPSEPAASAPFGERIRRGRSELLARADLGGRALNRALADHVDSWFQRIATSLGDGWALLATGGYGRRQLFPGSDIDVVLIHPRQVPTAAAAEQARALWYPIWDAGLKLSASVHTDRSLLHLAANDLVTVTSLFDVRAVVGSRDLAASVARRAVDVWRSKPWMWLTALGVANQQRWTTAGEVASQLEPNLKDGRGGLRDLDAVRWTLAVQRSEIDEALDVPLDDLTTAAAPLVEARCALHRVTGRTVNTLGLHDQDDVAASLGIADADQLMLAISAAARQIDWSSGRFWERVDGIAERGGRRRRPVTARSTVLTADALIVDGEVQLSAAADVDDPALVFRVAAAAARHGATISAAALVQLSHGEVPAGQPWDEPTRRAFLSLLGTGSALVGTIEDLDYYGLIVRAIPEWQAIRNLPQRNAFHRYTVDRHLMETVAEANALLRTVGRPDLLMIAALLHDIGKGRREDHSAVGVALTRTIAERMGFEADDIEVLAMLVDAHLLLPETATRRDLDDPRTAQLIAERVGTLDNLMLLRALTEADGRATGPTSWTAWKHHLVDTLVAATAAVLRGESAERPAAVGDRRWAVKVKEMAHAARTTGEIQVEHVPGTAISERCERQPDVVVVAAPDRSGLFATIAAALATHHVPVISADVYTTDDGLAVDQFRVDDGGSVNWNRLASTLRRAVAGEVDLDQPIRQRLTRPVRRRRAAAAAPVTEVLVDNGASSSSTVIEVRSPDAEAVLYRLAVVLRDWRLDVHAAKVATLGHEVVDVFYVRRADHPQAPQLPTTEHQRLRAALVAAIADPSDSPNRRSLA